MKSLVAAFAFLTTLPVGTLVVCDAARVARSAAWFPLVGVFLGAVSAALAALFRNHLPPAIIAVLIVILEALITGALHYDGLADTADGFGGGKNREDILRIMRDHNIGSFGGLALAALVAMKVTAYALLVTQPDWIGAFLLVPTLGRWSILVLTAAFPYARASASVVDGMGRRTFLWGSILMLAILIVAASPRAWIAFGMVAAASLLFGLYCRRRIAGITGDTLGANLQLCECCALLVFLWRVNP